MLLIQRGHSTVFHYIEYSIHLTNNHHSRMSTDRYSNDQPENTRDNQSEVDRKWTENGPKMNMILPGKHHKQLLVQYQ